ncbi:hypothetical protein Pmar_PMAR025882, partial [Perkinsus marinus ATCC 50983]
ASRGRRFSSEQTRVVEAWSHLINWRTPNFSNATSNGGSSTEREEQLGADGSAMELIEDA